MNEFFLIAKIVSAGKSGFVKVQLVPGISSHLKNVDTVFLDFWGQKKQFELEEFFSNKNTLFFKFNNFDDDREVSLLIGRSVFISSINAAEIGLDELSNIDVIGYKVLQDDKFIGDVIDYYQMPANPIIEIKNKIGKIILLPFVDAVIEKINSENKELVLKSGSAVYDDED